MKDKDYQQLEPRDKQLDYMPMKKTYKIEKLGHTFRNPTYVEKDGVSNADWNTTTLTFPFSVMIDKLNEIIDVVNSEALSDKEDTNSQVSIHSEKDVYKQEEMGWRVYKVRNGLWRYEKNDGSYSEHSTQEGAREMAKACQKQPTSLKSEIQEFFDDSGYYHMGDFTIEKLISLLQSHLLKEIPEEKDVKILGQTWEDDLSAANNCGYNQCREDIIKIINNLTK